MKPRAPARPGDPRLHPAFPVAILAAVAVILAGAGVYLAGERAQAMAQGGSLSLVQAQLLAEHAVAVFRQVELGLRAVLALLDSGSRTTADVAHDLERRVLFLPGVRGVVLIDAEGKTVVELPSGRSPEFDPAPLVAVHDGSLVETLIGSLPADGPGDGYWLTVSLRRDRPDGSFGGVLLALIDTGYFAVRYREYGTVNADLVALFDADGHVLASWPGLAGGTRRVTDLPLLSGMEPHTLQRGGMQSVSTPAAVVALYQLPDYALRMAVARDRERLLDPWRQEAMIVAAAALFVATGIAAASLAIRRAAMRRAAAELDLAASRGREELTRVFRSIAMTASTDLPLEEYLCRSLSDVRAFLDWPAALVHLHPSGIGLPGGPVDAADTDGRCDAAALQAALAEAAAAGGDLVDGPISSVVRLAGVDGMMVRVHEPGSPTGFFAFLAGKMPAPEVRGVLEEVARLIHRTAVHRLELRERQRMQQRLDQARRLESLGAMAGGLAHNVNNLMTIVMANADIVAGRLPPPDPSQPRQQDIREAARRGGEIGAALLAAAGKAWLDTRHVTVGTLLADLEPEVRATLPDRVDLALTAEDDDRLVSVDERLLRNALLSIVTNAVEALGGGGGHVEVTAGWRHHDAEELEEYAFTVPTAPGTYAWFEVRDDGPGMDEEARGRLFEPFSSTKMFGRGLGLPAVLGIVRQHSGGMRVQSRPGAGTTVTILLPEAGP